MEEVSVTILAWSLLALSLKIRQPLPTLLYFYKAKVACIARLLTEFTTAFPTSWQNEVGSIRISYSHTILSIVFSVLIWHTRKVNNRKENDTQTCDNAKAPNAFITGHG
jgi:hypothetical protein